MKAGREGPPPHASSFGTRHPACVLGVNGGLPRLCFCEMLTTTLFYFWAVSGMQGEGACVGMHLYFLSRPPTSGL